MRLSMISSCREEPSEAHHGYVQWWQARRCDHSVGREAEHQENQSGRSKEVASDYSD
jgi:hypothetical protein